MNRAHTRRQSQTLGRDSSSGTDPKPLLGMPNALPTPRRCCRRINAVAPTPTQPLRDESNHAPTLSDSNAVAVADKTPPPTRSRKRGGLPFQRFAGLAGHTRRASERVVARQRRRRRNRNRTICKCSCIRRGFGICLTINQPARRPRGHSAARRLFGESLASGSSFYLQQAQIHTLCKLVTRFRLLIRHKRVGSCACAFE